MTFDLFILFGLCLLIVVCFIGYFVSRRMEDENTQLHAKLAAQRATSSVSDSGIRR